MDEKYRLIFRGELLEGQHRAVVKRRLAELLKLDDARVEKLFSGNPVVLKRNADRKTAARYQALFKQAGGRLRIKAEQPDNGEAPRSSEPLRGETSTQLSESAAAGTSDDTADAIQAPDFQVQSTWFPPPEAPRPEIDAPEYVIAEVGANMADESEAPVPAVTDVDFDVAEVGADLLTEKQEVVAAAVGPLDFEVAEVGADLGPGERAPAADAPDVSHLAIVQP